MKLDPCHLMLLPRKVTHLMNSTVQPARHPKNPRGIRAFKRHIWADILGTHGKSPETCNLNSEDRAESLGIHNNFLQPQGLQRQGECGQPAASSQDNKPQPLGRCRYPRETTAPATFPSLLTYQQPPSDLLPAKRMVCNSFHCSALTDVWRLAH